jgi:hypothetical protein
VLHDGFDIMIPHVDMRDFLADKFKLEVVSSNELLLTMPSMPKWYLANFGVFHAHLTRINELCERAKQGHDVLRNAIMSDKKRGNKFLLLRFPENCVFSTRFYSEQISRELTCKIAPMLDMSFSHNSRQFHNLVNVVWWKVSVLEGNKRVVDRIESTQTKGEKELNKLLASMSLS